MWVSIGKHRSDNDILFLFQNKTKFIFSLYFTTIFLTDMNNYKLIIDHKLNDEIEILRLKSIDFFTF